MYRVSPNATGTGWISNCHHTHKKMTNDVVRETKAQHPPGTVCSTKTISYRSAQAQATLLLQIINEH